MGEEMEIRAAQERPYWETCTYNESNSIIHGNLETGQRAAITIGYYLKHIRENKLYLDGGYQNFGEYVRAECGMSESTASRNISRMEQFSEGGNSPKLADQWRNYGASQLQEIMYLTDEQREQVTPEMTVKEIREIRKPEPVPVPEPDPVEEAPVEVVICEAVELKPEIICEPVMVEEVPAETVIVESSVEEMLPDVENGSCGPARCITGQSGSGLCGGAAYCSEPYTCCAQCSNDCNGRCGWLKESNKSDDYVRDQMEYAVAATADPKIDFKALDQMISATKNVQVDQEEVATSQVAVVELVGSDCFYNDVTDKCPPMSRECENAVDVCCEDCMEQWCPTRCKHAKVPYGVELYKDYTAVEDVVEESPVPCMAKEITPQKLLKKEKEKLEQYLAAFEGETIVPEFIAEQKIIVGALAGMVCDLEEAEYVAPEQPELPIMRNNDQRKTFLDDYRLWPIWFRVPQADEIYYRYDFEDGTAFVIRETKYFNEWRIRYNEDPEGILTHEYILKQDYHYLSNCRSNRSEMIEYLRSLQKGVKA